MRPNKNLSRLLNKYILLNENSPEKEELFRKLKSRLPSPALAAEGDFIPAQHPLRNEAIILSDAFEALTNGMFSDELLEKLKELDERSLLYPWKPFILCVRDFYSGNWADGVERLNEISEDSAVSRFKALLRSIFEGSSPPEDGKELYRAILEDNRELKDSLELIKEAVGMEDLLMDTASLLIRDLLPLHRESGEKLTLWCLNRIQDSDILSDKSVARVRSLFGNREGYRLCALASFAYDPDRSLVFWLHALLSSLEEGHTDELQVKAYLKIILDTAELVDKEYELADEYLHLLDSLTGALTDNLFHIYPGISRKAEGEKEALNILRALAGEARKQPQSHKTRQPHAPAIQLELFSF